MKNKPITAMLGISLVIVLIALDQTVVGTAMPSIVADLKGYSLYPWIAAVYLLTNAIFTPIIGRLGDIHGRRPFLIVAIALFTVSSVFCAMASSMIELVCARALQGAGGGMLIGSAFASVPDLFPNLKQRVRWQVLLSSAFGISSAVGPALGGLMTKHIGWRSVFYVNLPIGLLAFFMVWRYLPRIIHHNDKVSGLDWVAVALLVATLFTLLLASEMGSVIGFLNPKLWILMIVSIALVYSFYKHQMRSNRPILPSHLLGHTTIRLLAVLSFLSGMMLFILIFYLPLLLQAGFALSPKVSGTLVTPILVGITVGSIINGRIIVKIKQTRFIYLMGVALLIIGLLALTQTNQESSHAYLLLASAFCGLGFGFQMPNLTLQMQATVAKADLGSSSALVQTLRSVGSMFGASIGGLLVNLYFNNAMTDYFRRVNIKDEGIIQLFDTPQILVRQIDQAHLFELVKSLNINVVELIEQARSNLISGVHLAFWAAMIISLGAICVSFFLPNISSSKTLVRDTLAETSNEYL